MRYRYQIPTPYGLITYNSNRNDFKMVAMAVTSAGKIDASIFSRLTDSKKTIGSLRAKCGGRNSSLLIYDTCLITPEMVMPLEDEIRLHTAVYQEYLEGHLTVAQLAKRWKLPHSETVKEIAKLSQAQPATQAVTTNKA